MFPNFIIIGAAKSGTTALYQYLQEHPDVFMSPIKEPNFFALRNGTPSYQGPGDETTNDNAIVDLDSYEELFDGVRGQHAIGEASPMYLYNPQAASAIAQHTPNAKLIAILRNPIERAHSAYQHLLRDHRENAKSFQSALDLEEKRIKLQWAPMWHYTKRGFYYKQLKVYYDHFPKKQILVLLHEDLDQHPIQTLETVYRFLQVDDTFRPDVSVRPNVSGIPKNQRLHEFLNDKHPLKESIKPFLPTGLLHRVASRVKNRNLQTEAVPSASRKRLQALYRNDISALQALIQRDCSAWLG